MATAAHTRKAPFEGAVMAPQDRIRSYPFSDPFDR